MAGNVAEWVADWHLRGYYQAAPEKNPTGPDSGDGRVLRGGSWRSDPRFLRTSYRDLWHPEGTHPKIGFRCAMDG